MPDGTQAGAAVTASEEDIRQFINQELEKDKQKAASQTGATYTPPPPEPLKISLDGKEFTFKDPQELNAALQTAFDQQRTREQQLRQQMEQTARPAEVKGKSKDDKEQWEFNKYVELMSKDPREAQSYLDRDRFGYNPVKKMKKLEEEVESLRLEAENSKRERVANGFRDAHPEFPGSPEAATVIDGIMQNMGFGFDPKGLEAAWAIAQTKGWLKPIGASEDGQQSNQQTQSQSFGRPTPVAPRVSRSSNSSEPDIMAQAEQMNSDQLEELLRRYSQNAR